MDGRSEEQRDTQEEACGEGVSPRIQSRWLHELLGDTATGTCEADRWWQQLNGIALHGLDEEHMGEVQRRSTRLSSGHRLVKTQACSKVREGMPRHRKDVPDSPYSATGQDTRARGRVCQLETFVMVSTCFAVGATTRLSLR